MDKRFQLEVASGLGAETQEDAVARLERLFSQVRKIIPCRAVTVQSTHSHGAKTLSTLVDSLMAFIPDILMARPSTCLITLMKAVIALCLNSNTCRRMPWRQLMIPTLLRQFQILTVLVSPAVHPHLRPARQVLPPPLLDPKKAH